MATQSNQSKVRQRNVDPLRSSIRCIKEGDLGALQRIMTKDLELLLQQRLLSPRVEKHQSPLVTAARYNRREMLLYLLENYEVNLEQETAIVIDGGHPVDGATPLWTASTLGHLDIVRVLVSRGANIEHTTDSRSSPLRGAAFDGHLPVVEYLIEKGADIDKPNQVGQSPLTIAAAMQKVETVQFLLEKGANIHQKGHNGDMPLHVAVESGSSKIAKILVEAGAANVPNDVGYTPAIMACCYGHQDIMEYLHQTFKLEHKELYDCYCLLVSKEILNSNILDAMKWVKKAIQLRKDYKDWSETLSKSDPVYDGIQEPTSEDDARTILYDDVMSFFLCSIYCERILGSIHPTTTFYIRISGDMALEECRYDKCMKLWLRSLEFDRAARMAYELQIIEDLLFSVRGFAIMVEAGYIPQIAQHFQWGVKEFLVAKKESKISEIDVAYCLCRMLAVWILSIEISDDDMYKMVEREKLLNAAKQLCTLTNKMKPSLLIACLRNIPVNEKQSHLSAASAIAHSKLPLHKVISLLLDNGCSLKCEDDIGNFPLHFAVLLKEDSSLECLKTLIEYGAHIDAVNHREQTPLDLALCEVGYAENKESIFTFLSHADRKYSTLQCLSAKTLVRECIPYEAILPGFLVSFVSEHETDGLVNVDDEEIEKKTIAADSDTQAYQ